MNKTGKIASLTCCLLVLVSCSKLFPNDQEMVQRAKNYLNERSINAAAIELRNALQKNPDNGEARYLLGNISLSYGDFATAAKEFQRAGVTGWYSEQAVIGLAHALLGMGNYRKLVDEVPIPDTYTADTRASLLALRARAEAGLGDPDQAGKDLDAATELNADSLQVLMATIKIQLSGADTAAAEVTLARAQGLYPENRSLQLIKAGMLSANGNGEAAWQLYQGVIDAEAPGFITSQGRHARLGLARLQLLAGQFAVAEKTVKPLYRRNPKDPEANYIGGVLAFEQGDYDLAKERVFKVLKQVPGYSPAHLLSGTINFVQKDYEQAVYYLSKYLAANPDNIDARKLLGRAYMMLGQHEEALKILRQAANGKTADADLLALTGLSELQSGATAAGIASLEKAVASAPENTALRSKLAQAYISAGETDSAIRELRLLVERDDASEQSVIRLVSAYLRAGQYDQAINFVLERLKRHPDDPGLLAMTGAVYAASGDSGKARNYYSKALKIRPHNLQVTMMLARLEEQGGNLSRAVELYKGLVDAGEPSAEPLLALARLAGKQGNTDQMVAWYERAREHHPQDVRSRVMLADYYLKTGKTDKAGALAGEALKLAPRNPQVLALQGRQMLAEKRYQEALIPLRQLVTTEPDSGYDRALLAEAYMQLEQYAAARGQLDVVLERQPYFLPALLQKARLEIQTDHFDMGLDYSQRAIKVDPRSLVAYELAGNASMGKQDYAAAVKAYAQVWKRQQTSGLVLRLSRALAGSGEEAKAASYLEQWLADHESDVQARELLGTVYQNQGKNRKAVTAYKAVLLAAPENPVALNNLAWLYLAEGNPEALELAQRAYQANPGNAGIKDTYGWILVKSGQPRKGVDLLAAAMDALPEVPDVRYHYAVALIKSGRDTEGRQRLRKLVDEGAPFAGRMAAEKLLENP